MALLEINPEAPAPKPDPIKIECEVYRGITVDTKYTPSSALLTWIEGSNWSVNYYSQVLNADSQPTAQALDREPAYQQYRLIKRMDLKVTQSLTFSQDPQTRTMTATGSGYTYPFLVPNVGDMFVADIGDGRAGVFSITSVSRMTLLKDSVYAIDYAMVDELTAERQADLDRKVIETLFYSRQSLYLGCGPYVTEEDKARGDTYQKWFDELLGRYMVDFFSQEHSCLLVPDQADKTYDHFVTVFLLAILDTTSHPRVRRIIEHNITAEPVMRQPTVWDALLKMDANQLYGITQRAILISTRAFRGHPTLQALGYMGIPWTVFPVEVPTDVDSQYDLENLHARVGIRFHAGELRRPAEVYVPQQQRNPIYFQSLPWQEGNDELLLPPDIHPVVKDDYYVFSQAFYDNVTTEQSKLELLTHQVLNNEAINTEQLDRLLDHVREWDNLERFYYYPVLFVILRTAIRRMV